MLPYRRRTTVQQRVRDRQKALSRKPDHIPVIVERKNNDSPAIDRDKFLVPVDVTCGQFLYVIRRRLHMRPSEALFLTCGNRVLSASTRLSSLYASSPDPEDGFLYLQYTLESAFGGA